MGHEFETDNEITVDATPEQVWEAIATGPGVDSWFMGRNEVQPGVGGVVRTDMGGFVMESTVTVWDPPNHLEYRGSEEADGTVMAFEFLIEGRAGGSTVVRLVHSGFLGGDDWESEYDALRNGDPMYLRTLGVYLTHFAGRTAAPITAFGPRQGDQEQVWEGLKRGLGLSGTVTEGDQVRFSLDAGAPVEGVVDSVLFPSFLGVRTSDGLYRFVGRNGEVAVGHHIFTPGVDREQAELAWQNWLVQLYA
jgi:uncharacterized protein YndB with AHSA1/START domain